jgi:serine/threonine protein kinase
MMIEEEEKSFEKVKTLISGSFGNIFLVKKTEPVKPDQDDNSCGDNSENSEVSDSDNFLILKEPNCDYGTCEMSKNECNILAHLSSSSSSSPYFVKMKHFAEAKNGINIYSEYFENYIDLFDFIHHHKSDDNFLLLYEISRQIIRAVGVIHNDANVVHLDIKPENILIDPKSGQVKLIDFGLSLYFPSSATAVVTSGKKDENDSQEKQEQEKLVESLHLSDKGTTDYKPPELFVDVNDCHKQTTFLSRVFPPPNSPFKMSTYYYSCSCSKNGDKEKIRLTKEEEQAVKVAKSIDLWSIGQTLYALLTGNLFFQSPLFKYYLVNCRGLNLEEESYKGEYEHNVRRMWQKNLKHLSRQFPDGLLPIETLALNVQSVKDAKARHPRQYSCLMENITQLLSLIPENRKLVQLHEL